MPNWSNLEKDIIKWLKTFQSDELSFRNSFQSIIGFPTDGFRSDGMLTDGNTLLAVEIEVSQSHPDTNTGKYLLLWHAYRKYRQIVLLHVYTPGFTSYGFRRELASFYMNNLSKPVPIIYLERDYTKIDDYSFVLKKVEDEIESLVKKYFG